MTEDGLIEEVERNYDWFQRHMVDFLPTELGRYALLRQRSVVGFYADAALAEEVGERFADRLYSIQLVDPNPINLGLYSNG